MNNKISVLIPVYNTADYISKCLDSILNQTHDNIEIIAVDDGSTDCTPQILDEYAARDSRVRVIHKTNGGHQSARKAAIEVATGDFITFVDSDDSLSSTNVLACMLSQFTADTVLVVGHTCMDYGNKFKKFISDIFSSITTEEYLKKLLTGRASWNLCGKLYRADLIKNNESSPIKVISAEDALYNILLLSRTKGVVGMVNMPVYNYFVRDDSITQSRNVQNIFDNFKVTDYIENTLHGQIDVKYLVAFKLLCFSNSFRYGWLGSKNAIYQDLFRQNKTTKEARMLLKPKKRIIVFVLVHFGDLLSKYIFKNQLKAAESEK